MKSCGRIETNAISVNEFGGNPSKGSFTLNLSTYDISLTEVFFSLLFHDESVRFCFGAVFSLCRGDLTFLVTKSMWSRETNH